MRSNVRALNRFLRIAALAIIAALLLYTAAAQAQALHPLNPGPLFGPQCQELPVTDSDIFLEGRGVHHRRLLVGIERTSNRFYIWERIAAGGEKNPCNAQSPYSPAVGSGVLLNRIGNPVAGERLRHVLLADLDGSGVPEIVGLQKDVSWTYAWKLDQEAFHHGVALRPTYDGDLTNLEKTFLLSNRLKFVVTGDFDGDGKEEIRGFQTDSPWNYSWQVPIVGDTFTLAVNHRLRNKSGAVISQDALGGAQTLPGGKGIPDKVIVWNKAEDYYWIWGTNERAERDGRIFGNKLLTCNGEELALPLSNTNQSAKTYGKTCLAQHLGDTVAEQLKLPWQADWSHALICDFNNDGSEDIAGPAPGLADWLVLFVRRSGGEPEFRFDEGKVFLGKSFTDAAVGDFDGDSKCDLMAIEQETQEIWVTTGDVFLAPAPVSWGRIEGQGSQVRVGDNNSDRRDDLFLIGENGETKIRLSTGDGFSQAVAAGPNTEVPPAPPRPVLLTVSSAEVPFGLVELNGAGGGGDAAEERLYLHDGIVAIRRSMEKGGHGPAIPLRHSPISGTISMFQADLDGDGLKNPVILDGDREAIIILEKISIVPAEGTRITKGLGKAVYSDRDGLYIFPSGNRGNTDPVPSKPGYAFLAKAKWPAVQTSTKEGIDFVAHATVPSPEDPPICVGFHPASGSWDPEVQCPENHAVFSLDDGTSGIPDLGQVFCCRLPGTDVLSGPTKWYPGTACPHDTVLTGSRLRKECDNCQETIACAALNTSRYQLGELRPGKYWGLGHGGAGKAVSLDFNLIPAAIRYAAGRMSHQKWDIDGCIGDPVGSLAVGYTTNKCADIEFRQLQYRGIAKDPPPATPVPMFADCADLSNIFSPYPRCK